MNLIEKLFKNRFKSRQSLEGVQQDDLWAAIEEGLDKESDKAVPFMFAWRWLAGLLSVLMIVLFGWYYFNTVESRSEQLEQSKVENEVALSQEAERVEEAAIDNVSTANETTKLNEEMEASKQEARAEKAPILEQRNSSTIIKNEKPIQKGAIKNSIKSTKAIYPAKIKNETVTAQRKIDASHVNTKAETIVDNELKTITASSTINSINDSFSTIEKVNLKVLSHPVLMVPVAIPAIAKVNLPVRDMLMNQIPIVPVKPLRYFEIGVASGINTFLVNYGESSDYPLLDKELNKSYSNRIGSSTSFRLSYHMGNRWSFSTGLDYDWIQTRFEYIAERPAEILDENSILRNAIEERSVLHFNEMQVLALPLEIGFRSYLGPVTLTTQLGLSYNLNLSQNGKTIDQQLYILEYDDEIQGPLPYDKPSLTYHLCPELSVPFSRNLKWQLRPSVKLLPFKQSEVYGFSSKGYLLSINTGLIYRL